MNALSLHPLSQPVQKTINIPGSKSYTIRALLLAALCPYPVRLTQPLISDDTTAMLSCLKTLGIETATGEGYIEVIGSIRDIKPGTYELNTDLSAASIRFLTALAAVIPGEQTLLGREGLNKRPIRQLVDSLRQMGADIEYADREGYPPVRVKSSSLTNRNVQIDGSVSSQYISAILMMSPLLGEPVSIGIVGESISKPYIDMTLSIMKEFGVDARNDNYRSFIIPGGQQYTAEEYTIEADASSAAYFAAIAALTRSTIALKNLNPKSAQADMRFLQILAAMGNKIFAEKDRITVKGHGVQPIEVDMQDCPDQAQTLAVLAAFADGITRITGIKSLRVKETNRLEAVATELNKMGIRTIVEEDALTIFGGKPQPAAIDTYGDHRMAMSFAVAGTAMDGIRINDPCVVSKTFPNFWEELEKIGVGVEAASAHSGQPNKIVLIGFMGAGKSLIAPLLAERLGFDAIEMDQVIVESSGRDSIKEIFQEDGEPHFRALELEVAESLRTMQNVVISAGGGVVTNPTVMEALGANGVIVHLDASLETVLGRVAMDNGRPLLKTRDQAQELYEKRKTLYEEYGQIRIQTDNLRPDEVVVKILSAMNAATAPVKEGIA